MTNSLEMPWNGGPSERNFDMEFVEEYEAAPSFDFDLESGAFKQELTKWIKGSGQKYWQLTGRVTRADGNHGMINFMLRRSSIKRFDEYQIDLIQINVREEDQRQGIFFKTAKILFDIASENQRGLYLECAHSKEIQSALNSKNHLGKWREVCDVSHNYLFQG